MLKAKLLLLLALVGLAPIYARERLAGYCEDGAVTVTTETQVSTTTVQGSYPSCTVTVYQAGTLTLARLFSDNSGTVLANSFTADNKGYWFFYADNGTYDVQFSGAGIPTPFTHGAQTTFDLKTFAYDILTYGAICDGTTNDSAAIQAAINAAKITGGSVLFPARICNLGSTGLTITGSVGVRLKGAGWDASYLLYTGSGAAVTIGVANTTLSHRHSIEDLQISITNASVSAKGVVIYNCLYCSMTRTWIDSNYPGSSSQQIGLYLGGGSAINHVFGAYFTWIQNAVKGTFKTGIKITGVPGWGWGANQWIGGAVIHDIGIVAGTVGMSMDFSGQNVIGYGMDIENFEKGYSIAYFDNTLVGARSEANGTGLVLEAEDLGTGSTGATATRIIGDFHSDGFIDNSAGPTMIFGSALDPYNGLAQGAVNRLNGFNYLDSTLFIPTNTGLNWVVPGGGGSTGLVFSTGTGSTPASPVAAGSFLDNAGSHTWTAGTPTQPRNIHINAAAAHADIFIERQGVIDMVFQDGGIGVKRYFYNAALTFANLGTPSGGSGAQIYCTDCKNVVDDGAAPGGLCQAGGAGVANARYENGHWACN